MNTPTNQEPDTQPTQSDSLDDYNSLYLKFMQEKDVVKKFNIFLAMHCKEDYAHLIDSDQNVGQEMRDAIQALYAPKPDGTVENKAIAIYEATRVEAAWSERPIVPEPWADRDEKFRKQFVDIIDKYLSLDVLPTPEEAHDSWMQSYFDMGWKYGEKRDTVAKTHPDLLPFNKLSQAERDKDAIFLAFVWVVRELVALEQQKEGSDG